MNASTAFDFFFPKMDIHISPTKEVRKNLSNEKKLKPIFL